MNARPKSARSETETAAPPALGLLGLRDILVILLAATSGYMDAVSYLGLGNVFTSNMTGNTVLLGLAIAEGHPLAAARTTVSLVAFLVGVAVGTPIVGRIRGGTAREAARPSWSVTVTVALTIEWIVLLLLASGSVVQPHFPFALVYALIACSAVAMGVQSVAVLSLHVRGVATTYITGTWTTLVSGLIAGVQVHLPWRGHQRAADTHAPNEEKAEARNVLVSELRHLQALVLALYVVGAIAGGLVATRWLLLSEVLPAVVLALVVLVAWLRFSRET